MHFSRESKQSDGSLGVAEWNAGCRRLWLWFSNLFFIKVLFQNWNHLLKWLFRLKGKSSSYFELWSATKKKFPIVQRICCNVEYSDRVPYGTKEWTPEKCKNFWIAAKKGDKNVLNAFVTAGAPVNCTPFGSQTPLYIACYYVSNLFFNSLKSICLKIQSQYRSTDRGRGGNN